MSVTSEIKHLQGEMRTHTCGALRESEVNAKATLSGWMSKARDLGGLYFIDIRDRYGLTQLSFEDFQGDLAEVKKAGPESVIWASGVVAVRPESAQNKNMATGKIELRVKEFKILSLADKDSLPFLPHGQELLATEDQRLRYRYIDIRTDHLQKTLKLRSDLTFRIRSLFHKLNFCEVETPILYKSTPEGARDYLVPSRVHPGKVFALPQSPQTLKQLLMIGSVDRYFQITKCFRDEDLRADRQPEFTQIDVEMSFVTQDSVKELAESILKETFSLPSDFKLEAMSYDTALKEYGTDRPDSRFGLKHSDVTSVFKNKGPKIFETVAKEKGLVKAIFVPAETGTLARKGLDGLVDIVRPVGGQGVAWLKQNADGRSGGVSKFFDDELYANLCQTAGQSTDSQGLWLFFASQKHSVTHACADHVRRWLGKHFDLAKKEDKSFLWVYDFPLLEHSEEDDRYVACHHPFTMPKKESLNDFMNGENLANIKAEAYDVVCNGHELGGGSLRIFDQSIQDQMFKVLGLGPEETQKQFGFFLEALKYGTPPHAGIAFGLDRLTMVLAGTDNIRDVIAFPKTTSASDLMSGCPSRPATAQWDELKLSDHSKKKS